MADTYHVKGASILSKLDYVREMHGTDAEERILAPLRGRGLIPFLTSSWYPYSLYVEVNETIADQVLGGDRRRLTEVGAHSAETSLTGTYRMLGQAKDFFALLDHLQLLHGRFYDQGKMTVERAPDESTCTIVLSGAPEYAEADIQIASGFYTKAAELTGRPGARIAIDRQPDAVKFDVSW